MIQASEKNEGFSILLEAFYFSFMITNILTYGPRHWSNYVLLSHKRSFIWQRIGNIQLMVLLLKKMENGPP